MKIDLFLVNAECLLSVGSSLDLTLNKTRILNAGLAQRQSATLVKWMSRFQNSYPAPLLLKEVSWHISIRL